MLDRDNTYSLPLEGKDILLIGTAHLSRESAEQVRQIIEEIRPDTVCIELCNSRYQSIVQKNRWLETNLLKVIREKKAFLLLSNLILAHFQKKIGKRLGITPGLEIIQAIKSAEMSGAHIYLADRDIRITLGRAWRLTGLWTRIKLLANIIASTGEMESLKEEDIERMKRTDVLETLLSEMGKSFPEIKSILIDERDKYLAHKIRTAPGQKIVAVVGSGHAPGIVRYWNEPVNLDDLERMPPKSRFFRIMKWGFPAVILGLIILGFSHAGPHVGTHMVTWWIFANAVLAALGAAIAMGHPLTVLSAGIAAPLTSLHPLIAAGWVSGLVEAVLGRPKVKDFENLLEDISSLKGFWKNKITRILLVVVLTNMGSSLGTFVAIPMMVKAFA